MADHEHMKWTHDGLMNDLAAHLRGPDRMVWCDMQLGPAGSPRPDVFTLQRSYSRPLPAAYEIKVSRSDFRSDTTKGKWQSYLTYAGSVTFAVPEGLILPSELPEGCGLIVRKDVVWRYARKPTIQRVSVPFDACMKLLLDGVDRVSRSPEARVRRIELWKEHAAIRAKFGEAVALAATDLARAITTTSDLNASRRYAEDRMHKEVTAQKALLIEQAKSQASHFEGLKSEICEWLDLPPETGAYEVRRKLADMRQLCDRDARVRLAEKKVEQARSYVESALASLAPKDRR